MEYNILVIIHDEYSIALTEIFFIFFRNTAYIQQVGRAGRSGGQCAAVIFCNNSDLGRQGVTSSVKDYCKNDTICRKTVIDTYFGFTSHTDDLTSALCCDVCNAELKCDWQF